MNPQKQHTLPEGWEMKRLEEITEINPTRANKFNDSFEVAFLGMADVSDEGKMVSPQVKTYKEVKNGFTKFTDKDILVAKITPCFENGKGALVDNLTNGIGFGSTEFHVICAKQIADENYIFYHTMSYEFRQRGKQQMSGSAGQQRIPSEFLRSYKVACPPLPEQRRIAAVLGTWDTAIEQTTELLKALRARHRGLMHQLLTGKARLPGFGGEWKQVKANEIFRNVSIRNRPNEPLLSVTQERGVIPRSMLEGRVTMPESETSSYKLVVPGDFIISLRSFQGGIETSDYQGVVSPAYTVLKPKIEIEDNFYRHYFKSIRFIRQLGVAVIGIRDGKQISFDDFSAIAIPLPSLDEQRAIAQVLDASLKEIQQQEAKLEVLREQKRGLMQCLLTGRVRVPAA